MPDITAVENDDFENRSGIRGKFRDYVCHIVLPLRMMDPVYCVGGVISYM
jgi:hypothetical protein